MKLLLFDIDGTILRSGGAAETAFSKAFAQLFSVENAWGNMRAHGKTDPIIFRELALKSLGRDLTSNEYVDLIAAYVDHSKRELAVAPNFRLMPNIARVCELLSVRKDIALGIQTGNYKVTADLKLEKGGVHKYFSFGGYACDSEHRAEFVRIAIQRAEKTHQMRFHPKDIFVIGDTIHDIAAAHSVGAQAVAVATGPAPEEELLAAKPEHFFKDLSEEERFFQIIAS